MKADGDGLVIGEMLNGAGELGADLEPAFKGEMIGDFPDERGDSGMRRVGVPFVEAGIHLTDQPEQKVAPVIHHGVARQGPRFTSGDIAASMVGWSEPQSWSGAGMDVEEFSAERSGCPSPSGRAWTAPVDHGLKGRGSGMRALLLIDLQMDYFPGGRMPLTGAQAAVSNAGILLARFREAREPVFHVQHVSSRPGATFFLPGTPGVEIHAAVRPLAGETVVVKGFPNSFRETGLQDRLATVGVQELVVAGMMTHMCVDTTVRAAFDLGYQCVLAHDACATKALSFRDQDVPAASVQVAYIAALSGIFATIKSTGTIAGLSG